jgi:excisionase family DNA binding protein
MAGDFDDLVRSIAREEALRIIGSQPERAVTVRAAAIRLSVDEKTIRRLIAGGQLRAVKVTGKALRIPGSELDRVLREGIE